MKYKFPSLGSVPSLQSALCTAAAFFDGEQHSLPPLLVTLPTSVELEPLMNDLCLELEQAGLTAFTGDKPWLNIKLSYSEGAEFPSFSLMLESLRRHAGYHNDFAGVVRLDLTEWLDHVQDSRVDDLLAFVYDYSDEIFFLASVTDNDARRADPLKMAFNRWLYTLTVDVEPPSPELLVKVVERRLRDAGHMLAADARELIGQSVATLAAQEDFAGMREIESFIKAIVFHTAQHKKISAVQIACFAPDGEWMARRMGPEKMTIGFGGGIDNEK